VCSSYLDSIGTSTIAHRIDQPADARRATGDVTRAAARSSARRTSCRATQRYRHDGAGRTCLDEQNHEAQPCRASLQYQSDRLDLGNYGTASQRFRTPYREACKHLTSVEEHVTVGLRPVEDKVEHDDCQLVLHILVSVAVALGLLRREDRSGHGTRHSGAYAFGESHVAATKLLDEVAYGRSTLDAAHISAATVQRSLASFRHMFRHMFLREPGTLKKGLPVYTRRHGAFKSTARSSGSES
jgi:hypothetical protein